MAGLRCRAPGSGERSAGGDTGSNATTAAPAARSRRTDAVPAGGDAASAAAGPPEPGRARTGGLHRWAVDAVRTQYRRRVSRTPDVRMTPCTLQVDGRTLQYAVSDNFDAHGPDGPGTPPVWAVNIHGYFAGGQMYWRESARLAQRFGWRVVNPSLPGFGGSDPLGWHEVSLGTLTDRITRMVDHLGAGPVVLLGHSMGCAVAVRYAHDRPEGTLGLVYRDGVATPAWRDRHGPVQAVVSAISPNMAPFADFFAAFVLDGPDLLIGRMYSTMRAVLPDVRRNVRTMGLTMPVAALLMTVDLRSEVGALAESGMPILAEWGSFDRVAGPATADEFARWARTTVQWVPGGHSWMLARPQGQADVLTHLDSGKRFLAAIEARRRVLAAGRRRPGLRTVR